MYGLEKKDEKKFDFDLEIEWKKKPEEKNKILKKIKENILEIKSYLKTKDAKNAKQYEIILNAYISLEKVISKIK